MCNVVVDFDCDDFEIIEPLSRTQYREGTELSALYSIPMSEGERKRLSRRLVVSCGSNNSRGATYSLAQHSGGDGAGVVSIPRALGIAQFGSPAVDLRTIGIPLERAPFVGDLSSWQLAVNDRIVQAFRTGPYHGGILWAECGLGKTVLAIKAITDIGRRAAVLVHKTILLDQWKRKIEQFAPDLSIGRIHGKECDIKDVTIIMIQTLCSGRYDCDSKFDSFGCVVWDECHHLPARTFNKVCRLFKARYVLGLSATLERCDQNDRVINWLIGPIIAKCTRKHCSDASPTVQFIPGEWFEEKNNDTLLPSDARKTKRRHGRPSEFSSIISRVIRSERRNARIVSAVTALVCRGYHVLCISERVEHIRILSALMSTHALTAITFIGEAEPKRRRVRDECLSATPDVVLTSKAMAAEALDWPVCGAVVIATPVPTGPSLQQIVGRCRRGIHKKPMHAPVIVDVADVSPMLCRLATGRLHWYNENGFLITKHE